MNKDKQKYWTKRKAQRMVREMDQAEQTAKVLDEVYNQANRALTSRIEKVFENYRRAHGLTANEAERLLKGVRNLTDIRALKTALQSSTDSEEKHQLMMLLDSAPYASRIREYERLQKEIAQMPSALYGAEKTVSDRFYQKFIPEAYYHSIFDLQQQSGVGFAFNKIDPQEVKQVMETPWLGSNYSERIWGNTQTLAKEVQKEVAVSLLTGRSYREAAEAIDTQFGKGKFNAKRLIRTETAYFHAEMEGKAYEEAEVEKYRFLATLDLRTSSICREHDGEVYEVAKRQTGVNYPPMHPWCRSDTIALDDDEWLAKASRSARDPETGKTIQVPADMKYDEWYQEYVTKPRERELAGGEFGVNLDYVRSQEYLDKLKNHPRTANIADSIVSVSRKMLQHRNGTPYEDYYLLDATTGKVVAVSNKARKTKGVVYNDQVRNAFKVSSAKGLVSIHNHPSGYPPSLSDLASLQQRSKNNTVKYGLTVGHDGSVYWYSRPQKRIPHNVKQEYEKTIAKLTKIGYTETKAQELVLFELAKRFNFIVERIE